MSLRKTAGLLAAFGLMVGMVGAGVGASFFDSVTAEETVNVGTFSCVITDATAGAIVADDQKSVTYTAPTINSSAPGSAPFYFQVYNAGSIAAALTVTASPALSAPWSYIGMPIAAVNLAPGATQNYNTGVQWTELFNGDLGTSGTVKWTVSCVEVPAVRHWSEGIAGATSSVFPSTNAINEGLGWPYVTVDDSTITFQSLRLLGSGGSCIEYRFNDNVPDQIRHTVNGGNNWNTLVTDGLWPSKCIGIPALNPTATIAIPAGVTTFEVRSAFGAESDERFDWTRFNLLP